MPDVSKDGAPAKLTIAGLALDYVNPETGAAHRAVEDLDLQVATNEFLCVLGPSGCGKSTLLAAIAGFIAPSRGSIVMDGRPVTGPGAERGVVFQEYALLPWMNVLDNAALGLKLRGIPRDQRYATARRFLALTNLHDVEHKFPHELSGGMKQRVAVARTLANAPEVMLMDEPFAAVDAQTRMTLQEELGRISAASRLTVMFITHSVEEAIFLGDRVAVMTPGPGRIRTIVDVPFARSGRTWNALNPDPAFAALREQLLELVRTRAGIAREPVAAP
jgi:NitT/TauT family transport system ATP-binding protein